MIEYRFYVGYKSKDGKFHAWGPFDRFNNLKPILYKTGGFISDLPNDFYKMDIESMDDFLKEKFIHKGFSNELCFYLWYLPVDELPSTNFIKHKYFLIDDLAEYMSIEDPDVITEYDYESYTVDQYNIYCTQAIQTHNQEEMERLSKFQYWTYADTSSKEYESFLLSQAMSYNGFSDKTTIEYELKDCHPEESPLDFACVLLYII